MTKRAIVFDVDVVLGKDYEALECKTICVEIEVTKPNKDGIFKIITKIGDETPTERIVSIDNNKIVKTY